MKSPAIEPIWLTTRRAMEYLGVSRDFIDERRKRGELPFSVWGGKVFIRKDDIDKIIQSNLV